MLKEKIQEDLKTALKEKKEIELSVLRMILAAISNREITKRTKIWKEKPDLSPQELEKESVLTDEEILEVISSEIRKRKEAILEFEKGLQPTIYPKRKKHIRDLVEKEKAEIEVLNKYLPEQLSGEEIKKLAKETIEKVGAKELKDMGKVMAELMPEVKGRAEGSLVSEIVKKLLTSKNEEN